MAEATTDGAKRKPESDADGSSAKAPRTDGASACRTERFSCTPVAKLAASLATSASRAPPATLAESSSLAAGIRANYESYMVIAETRRSRTCR